MEAAAPVSCRTTQPAPLLASQPNKRPAGALAQGWNKVQVDAPVPPCLLSTNTPATGWPSKAHKAHGNSCCIVRCCMHCAHQIVRGVDGLGAVANEQRLRGQLGPGDLQSNRVGMVLAGYAGFLLEFTCTALAWGASGCWALPLPHDHQLAGFASCPAVGLQST